MKIEAGMKLGPYEIVAPIGKGGMGEVWRARDERLDRDVAIKVLPEMLSREKERVLRLEREAKLLASLNHPNIAQIYGFEELDDAKFLVLEYVQGEMLAARLKRGALAIDEALDTCQQIAEALEAAHNRGVIHRDFKPGNVMITPERKVKVLDFGLARAMQEESSDVNAGADSPTITADYTKPGVVLGTAPYMSPEQARGRPIDQRTDIWSFGVVLYECLTGRMLFGGATANDSIGAILHKDPDWARLPAGTPQNVRHILGRCLVKNIRHRLHHIADARIELEQTEAPTFEPRPATPVSRKIMGLLATIAIISVTVSAWSLLRDRAVPSASAVANPLDDARFSKITNFPGSEFGAAISPDGRFVAFISNRDGPFDIFVSQVDAGGIRNLTRGRAEFRPDADVSAKVRPLGFVGDGTEIWFRRESFPWRLRATPLLGGDVRNLLGEDIVNLAWSPDGQRIVYHTGRNDPGDPLYVADREGTNRRLILQGAEGEHQHFPIWSVDGRWIYLARGRPPLEMSLWRVRPDGGEAEPLTWTKLDVRDPTPIDERTVIYSAMDEDGAGPWLWTLDVKTKSSRRASTGMERYDSVSASADGRRLVATLQTPHAALWSVPILDRVATEDDAQLGPDLPTQRAFAPRVHRSGLFYLSSRGSGDGLWRYRDGNSQEIWRGSATPLLEPAAVSPNGESLALVLRRGGKRRLHLLSADGAQLTALSEDVEARGAAAWSPDGKWVVVGGKWDGAAGLFKMPVDGGAAECIVSGVALNPVWSPAGDLIVYAGAEIGPAASLQAVRPDGSPVAFPQISVLTAGERMRFLPDGSGLVYMKGLHLQPHQDFWMLDMETMKTRQLTQLDPGATMRTFDITPDGSRIVFDRLTEDSDIVLIERKTTDSPIAGEE